MKSFGMMFLPLLVGTFFLFCGTPKARATTCESAPTANSSLTNDQRITDAKFVDTKSLLADEARSLPIFYHRSGALKPHKSQFTLGNGRADRIWILTFLDLPAGTVKGFSNVPTSFPPIASLEPATTLTTTTTSVPESSSLLYLGSGLIVCGGLWLRRRRF
jgi:hypothetical protein